jgi:hypothetical protein
MIDKLRSEFVTGDKEARKSTADRDALKQDIADLENSLKQIEQVVKEYGDAYWQVGGLANALYLAAREVGNADFPDREKLDRFGEINSFVYYLVLAEIRQSSAHSWFRSRPV